MLQALLRSLKCSLASSCNIANSLIALISQIRGAFLQA